LRGKLKRAAWDDSFLVDMLLNTRLPWDAGGGGPPAQG
jgi:hypothetical protein